MNNFKTFRRSFLSPALVVILVVAAGAAGETTAGRKPQKETTSRNGLLRYQSEELGLSLEYPENWHLDEQEMFFVTGVSITSRKREKKTGFKFSTSSNEGSQSGQYDPEGASLGISVMPSQGESPLELYANPQTIEFVRHGFYEGKVVQELAPSTVSGREATFYTVQGENADYVSFEVVGGAIAGDGSVAIISMSYPAKRESEFRAVLDAMLDSIVLTSVKRKEPVVKSKMKDPMRERSPDASPPPKLSVDVKAAVSEEDIAVAKWTWTVTNEESRGISITCAAVKMTTADGMSMTSPTIEAISLKPGESHVLGTNRQEIEIEGVPEMTKALAKSVGDSLGYAGISNITSLVKTGSAQIGVKGEVYFEDENGEPFSAPYEKTQAVHLAGPEVRIKPAKRPKIKSVTVRFDRPPRLAPEKVKELDVFVDFAVDNPNGGELGLVDSQLKWLNDSLGHDFKSPSKGSSVITFEPFWLRDEKIIQGLLTGEIGDIPIKGRMLLYLKEPGWNPAIFQYYVDAKVTISGDSGTTSDVKQTEE
ncbi:hypothetical protein ACFL1X_12400 [Candidatus Hydrogenedentota bacterium]